MELSDDDKKMLSSVHDVFYQAGLIKTPQLAQLGIQFTVFMQKVLAPKAESVSK